MDQIELPNFAQELASLMECEKCANRLRLKDVVLCGVRREADGVSYFHFASVCPQCGEWCSITDTTHPMTIPELGDMIREELPPPKPRPLVFGGAKHLTTRKPTGPILEQMSQRGKSYYHIYGGYYHEEHSNHFLLYRWFCAGRIIGDHLLRIDGQNTVRTAAIPEEELLPDGDWNKFLRLPEGGKFRLGAQVCRKLTGEEVLTLIQTMLPFYWERSKQSNVVTGSKTKDRQERRN